MREPHIYDDDPHLEHNPWGADNLKYKGELFTGTLLYNDTDPVSYAEYKNGDYDGESVAYHKNGKIAEHSFFKDGEYISGKEWYDNGQLKHDDEHWYDQSGKLIRINGSWLYPNGTKRNGQEEGEHYYFSPAGELAIKIIVNRKGDYKNTVIYYDKVMEQCYRELLINLYPEFDAMYYNTEYYFWGWVAKKYSLDRKRGLELYEEMEKHADPGLAGTAKEILSLIRNKTIDFETYAGNYGYHIRLE